MSGKRQHYIPRMLLRNFFSRIVKEEFYTWVYRKNSKEYESNIINVGVEGYFYARESDTELDDMITNDEGGMSKTLDDLLNSSVGEHVSCFKVSEMVTNFEVRTRHLRQNLLQTGDYAFSRYIDFMEDEDSFLKYLTNQFRKNPSMLIEAISDNLVKQGFPQEHISFITQMILPVAQNKLHEFIKPLLPLLMFPQFRGQGVKLQI